MQLKSFGSLHLKKINIWIILLHIKMIKHDRLILLFLLYF